MKNNYGPYFILIIHLITLTIRIYFQDIIDNVFQLQISTEAVNTMFNKLFQVNKVFDSGKLDLISFINLLLFIIIGYKFIDSVTIIILTMSIIEGCLIYYNETGQLLIHLIISIIGYFIGVIISSHNKNKKYEYNMNRLMEYQYSGI